MTIRGDAERLVAWLFSDRRDKWITKLDICTHFGWEPGAKTERRMTIARHVAAERNLCLTYATWDHSGPARYLLTETNGDAPVTGIVTRKSSISTQDDNVQVQVGFVRRHSRDPITREIAKMLEEEASAARQREVHIVRILAEQAKRK